MLGFQFQDAAEAGNHLIRLSQMEVSEALVVMRQQKLRPAFGRPAIRLHTLAEFPPGKMNPPEVHERLREIRIDRQGAAELGFRLSHMRDAQQRRPEIQPGDR
jgi:hypothetical protein